MKINKKVFLKNLLASWYWILFNVVVCLVFAALTIAIVLSIIDERILLHQKASDYEVTEGIIESVEVNKYYSKKRAGGPPDLIPDRKYEARISYIDKNGTEHQFTASETDKKLTRGQRIKIAYHRQDAKDADIAYYDIFLLKYMPCYMNTFEFGTIVVVILFALLLCVFDELLIDTIKECAQEQVNIPKPKSLKVRQLRTRRNICTLLACAFVPIGIFFHYGYLNGKGMFLLTKLDSYIVGWPEVCRGIAVAFVCYFPALLFWMARIIYEYRRLAAKRKM